MNTLKQLKQEIEETAVLMIDLVVNHKEYTAEYVKLSDVIEKIERFKKQERAKNRKTSDDLDELSYRKQIPIPTVEYLKGYLKRGKEILGV